MLKYLLKKTEPISGLHLYPLFNSVLRSSICHQHPSLTFWPITSLLFRAGLSAAVLPLAQATAGWAAGHICQCLHQSLLSSQSVITSSSSTPASLQVSLFSHHSSIWFACCYFSVHISDLTFPVHLSQLCTSSFSPSTHSWGFPPPRAGHYSPIISLISCWLDLFF